jgi:hypothetical protein
MVPNSFFVAHRRLLQNPLPVTHGNADIRKNRREYTSDAPSDRGHISLVEPADVAYWTRAFAVSRKVREALGSSTALTQC